MSYNSYGRNGYNYSPYYQQQGQQQANTNAQAHADQANTNVPYYRSLQDVPAQAPPAAPPQYSSGQASPGVYGATYSYQTYGTPNITTESSGQTSRAGVPTTSTYYDKNARSYVDTTALGSLAYASALGRNSPAVGQSANTQRRASSNGVLNSPYGASGNVMSGYSQPRSDSRGSVGTSGSHAQNSPISPYAASIAANALAQAQKSTNRASPQLQYRADQASNQNHQNTAQTYGSLNRASDSAYPTGPQDFASVGTSKSTHASSSSQRPAHEYTTTNTTSSTTQHKPRLSGGSSGYTGSSYGSGTASTGGLPPLQHPNHRPNATTPMDQSRLSEQSRGNQTQQLSPAPPDQPSQTAAGRPNSNTASISYGRPDTQFSNSQSTAQTSAEQHPVTVDPSQVFNLQEYQRRKAEAEAEGARKATEQRKTQNPTSNTAANQTTNQSGSQAKQHSAEPGSKEQIEAEIKAMIEKMREYKAKDPTLFSEVWEQFKKVQPPPRASSQAPQASKESQTVLAGAVHGSEVASPGFMENGPLPIPSPILDQPSIPSTDNPDQLPDLGKFPFLRRKRKSKGKPELHGMSFHEVSASDIEASGPASSHASPMQHTAAASQWPAGPGHGAPGEEPMRQAMQAFHGVVQPHKIHFVPPTLSGPSQTGPGRAVQHGHQTPASVHYGTPYGGSTSESQSSYTIWPENKKTGLAAVAKQTLESYPANSEKTISADEIRSMLDKNPSYADLCKVLETKGFKFERGEFARVLLSAAPEARDKTMGPAGFGAVVKRSKRKPDDDSPRRPRGRPRKDGLPPRQHAKTQAPATNGALASSTTVAAPHTPQNAIPLGYSASGPQSSANILQGDTHDQNLAAALTSAISQIKGETTKRAVSTHPPANTGRPLQWDEARQVTAESLRKQNESNLQTGPVVESIAGPPPLISRPLFNGVHPGFGLSGQGPPASHIQGLVQPSQSFNPQNHPHQRSSASASILPQHHSTSAPTVVTKEQMARKRDFNEIVDLTQESEEELTYQRKRVRLFLDLLKSQNVDTTVPAQGRVAETIPVQPHPSPSNIATKPGSVETLPDADTHISAAKPQVDLPCLKAVDTGLNAEREALRSADVVQELNKKHALKKIKYNPKTIARDILITLGLHPTEKPLNWHLNGLRRNFAKVTASSDLSTFRWDIVDPGGPDLRPTAEDEDADDEAEGLPSWTSAPLPGQLQSGVAVISPKGGYDPARDTIGRAPSRDTTPGNVSIAIPGDQSIAPPRNTRGRPRGRPRGSKAKPRPQGGTPDGLVSQAKPSRGSRGARPPGAHLQPSVTHQSRQIYGAAATSSMAHSSHGSETNATFRPLFGAAPPTKSEKSVGGPTDNIEAVLTAKPPVLPTVLAVRVPSMTPSPLQPEEASQKRRGRPPGSINKPSISGSGRRRSPETESGPRPRGRPPGSKTGTPTRGRPSMRKQAVSYRTTVPPDGVGVILPSRSPSTSSQALSHVEENIPTKDGKKGRGRPSHRATSPSYQVFNCRWRGCEAKLHNLETLRKHVFKLHGKKVNSGTDDEDETEAKVPCLWSGCEQDGIFSSTNGPRRFASEDDWKHHVEKKHLEATAWELGDGPSAHPSDVEPMSYLSDSQGHQITPLARTQGPPDSLPPGSGPSPTRAYHKAHGNVTEHQKTQAELDSRVATKQVAGVFIGRLAGMSSGKQAEEESEDEQSESEDDSDNMDTP